ncbi:MAG: YkgJ family cysteine cluster protein [Armatimonadetes bacterium]|nr:YkgJ family cysteine cluster protein [Armatimonadota bacterium]
MTPLPVLDQAAGLLARLDQAPCNGCDACGTRCTAGIRILKAEFEAIQAELARLPAAEVARVIHQEKRLPIPGTAEQYVACRFRDVERGRCLIYPARPLICRLFGHVEWLPCPIQQTAGPQPGGVALMQAYADYPRQTYEEWLSEETAASPSDS